MRFMDESSIEEAVRRFPSNTVLGRAARFLNAFKNEVNAHSDGWSYWASPVQAANKLIELVDSRLWAGYGAYATKPAPTEAEFQKTLTPIKSFMTRRGAKAGLAWPEGF